MQSKEIIIKLEEARIQSKYVKPGYVMFCKISTYKHNSQTKVVSSSQNPVWNELKVISWDHSKPLIIDVFQGVDLRTSLLLASISLPIPDLISTKRTWWAIFSNKLQVGTILLNADNQLSARTSPLKNSYEGISFKILSEREKEFKRAGDLAIRNERLNENKINMYITKVTLEIAKINNEKSHLKEIKHKINIKEASLIEERKEVEKQKKEIAEEMKTIQALRSQLSKDYADLKCEKFRHRTQKILLNSRQRKILVVSSQILRQRKLINKRGPELSSKPLFEHSLIGLTEYVTPILADSDSPLDESPINTLESI